MKLVIYTYPKQDIRNHDPADTVRRMSGIFREAGFKIVMQGEHYLSVDTGLIDIVIEADQ